MQPSDRGVAGSSVIEPVAGEDSQRAATLLWESCVPDLKARLSEGNFTAWFSQTRADSLDGETFVLSVPSPFVRDWIQTRYMNAMWAAISRSAGRDLSIALVADESLSAELEGEPVTPAPSQAPVTPIEELNFHPKYTFDSFVIGSSNRFAHAAALAVGEAPATAYNPLFIYGEAGLGKTQLLHANGRYVAEWHPNFTIQYVSTEQFLNYIVSVLQHRQLAALQRRYRAVDLLLLDDIQFIEGKERFQEELFHTFNALHPRSQIVLTSDRPPKKIATLEERLRTRFEWGLITDIQPPDLETRLAILRKKTETDRLHVSDEVMDYIASRIQTNIRELEGALIRVTAYASLTRSETTLELAQEVLSSVLPESSEARVTADLVMSVASEYFDVTPDELRSPNRSRPLVNARQIAMYLCRELTDLSLPAIGAK